MKEVILDNDEICVKCDISQDTKDKLFHLLLSEYYLKHECFNGELIMQSDDPIIKAPEILSCVADDVFQFEVEYKD